MTDLTYGQVYRQSVADSLEKQAGLLSAAAFPLRFGYQLSKAMAKGLIKLPFTTTKKFVTGTTKAVAQGVTGAAVRHPLMTVFVGPDIVEGMKIPYRAAKAATMRTPLPPAGG